MKSDYTHIPVSRIINSHPVNFITTILSNFEANYKHPIIFMHNYFSR